MPFPSIGGGNIDILADKIYINIICLYLQERLTTKVPPVMSMFWAFAKRPEAES